MKCNNLAKNGVPEVIWSQIKKGLPNFAIEKIESPKMYRILQDFGVRANFSTALSYSTESFFAPQYP